jgi:hypothetical protein
MAAHQVDDEDALAGLGLDQRRAASGRARRIIQRADQPRRAFDEDERLALVPGVVAERDRIGAGVDQLVIDRLGDAEAAGRILAVDDDEIELPLLSQGGKSIVHHRAAGPAQDVSDKKNTHSRPPAIDHFPLR